MLYSRMSSLNGRNSSGRPRLSLLGDSTGFSHGGTVNPLRPAHNSISEPHSIHAILQDAYDVTDDDDVHSQDANYYDASSASTSHQHGPGGGSDTTAVLPEVRINMEPSDRLIDAIEQLKDVIVENTSAQAKNKRHRGPGGTRNERHNNNGGLPMSSVNKDDRLKVRKEKVRIHI